MTNGEFVNLLVKNAKEYHANGILDSLARNRHMHNAGDAPKTSVVLDAVLIDFVNFVAMKRGIDLALYADDLKPSPPPE